MERSPFDRARRSAARMKASVIKDTSIGQLEDWLEANGVEESLSLGEELFNAIDGGETFSHIIISKD